MKLNCESEKIEDYLTELTEVNYSHASIQNLISQLFATKQTNIEKIEIAF